jgi:hypothetical protein
MEKLKNIGVIRCMYNAIKTLHQNVSCSVRVNGLNTKRFDVELGVKKGCVLYPILFSIFVNDLVPDIRTMNMGIDMDGYKLSILLFVDNIALIADSLESLQAMLDTVTAWCNKWRLCINVDKTKVVHFRTPSTPKTLFNFTCSGTPLEITDCYKYLGLTMNEHLDQCKMVTSVAKPANLALGLLIAKHKTFKGMPHDVFSKLYDALVAP